MHGVTETPRSRQLAPSCPALSFQSRLLPNGAVAPPVCGPTGSAVWGNSLLPTEAMEHEAFAKLALSAPGVSGYMLLEHLSVE